MANDTIGITLTANSASVEAAFDRMIKALEKVEGKLDSVGKASEKSNAKTESGLDRAAKAAAAFGASFIGVAAATAAVNRELEVMKQRQEAVRAVTIKAGEAVAAARLNFQADATVGDSDLEKRLQEIATARGVSTASVARTASNAFSAGAKDNAAALRAVSAAYGLTPDEATAGELAGRALDLQKHKDVSPEASLGYMAQLGRAARITDIRKLGQTAVPAIAAITQQGDTVEQAGELFATFTQLGADTEGSKSANAAIGLAEKLGQFVAKGRGKDDRGKFSVPADQVAKFSAAKNTAERIAVMQSNPELRRAFLAEASFGVETGASSRAILSGDRVAMEALAGARAGVPEFGEGSAAAYREKSAAIAAGRFDHIVSGDRMASANVESLQLGSTRDARIAATRKILKESLSAAGDGAITSNVAAFGFDASMLGSSDDPETVAATNLRVKAFKTRRDGGEESGRIAEFLERQAALLERQLEESKRSNRLMEEQTRAFKASAPLGTPSRPVSSAALNRS